MRWLVLLCSVLVLSGCSEAPAYPPLPAGSRVLVLGDSLSYGTGAARGQDYPSRLAQLSGWDIVNAGVAGDTVQAAGRRLDALLASHRPDLVLIELGGNDFLQRRSESEVKADLRIVISRVRQAGARPVLLAVPRFSLLRGAINSLADAPLYAELADEEGLPLLADSLSELLSDESLRADPIHLNGEGYRRLAEALAVQFARMGLLPTGGG